MSGSVGNRAGNSVGRVGNWAGNWKWQRLVIAAIVFATSSLVASCKHCSVRQLQIIDIVDSVPFGGDWTETQYALVIAGDIVSIRIWHKGTIPMMSVRDTEGLIGETVVK